MTIITYRVIVPINKEKIVTGFNGEENSKGLEFCEINDYITTYISNSEDYYSNSAVSHSWKLLGKREDDNIEIISEGSGKADGSSFHDIKYAIEKFISITYISHSQKGIARITTDCSRRYPSFETIEGYENARGFDVVRQVEEKEDIEIDWKNIMKKEFVASKLSE